MAPLLGPAPQLGQQPASCRSPARPRRQRRRCPAALQIVERLPEPFELRLAPDRMVVAQRHRRASLTLIRVQVEGAPLMCGDARSATLRPCRRSCSTTDTPPRMCSGVRGLAGLRQPAAPALGSVHLPRGRPRRLVARGRPEPAGGTRVPAALRRPPHRRHRRPRHPDPLTPSPQRLPMHPDPKAYARRWKTLAVLSLSLLIIGLDNTVLNVALPTLQTQFSASGSTLQWIVDAYLLSFAGVLLTMGTLGDRFGRKRALQWGLGIFGGASVLAAFAQNADQLIVLRAVMGIGGAMIMPATLSVIMDVFPREERGKAIGIWSAIAGVGIGLGPFVGGLLLEWFSWSSVFWLNVPIVAVALVAGRFLVPESRDPRPGAFDLTGAGALDRDARLARLRDHRGRPARLDRSARPRLLRARGGARRRVRRLGAPRPRADASARLLPQPELHRGLRQRRPRLLRDDGLGLRLHAVPAVRAWLQRAGGRRGDDPAGASGSSSAPACRTG